MRLPPRFWQALDAWLALAVLALVVFGLAAIYSVALSLPQADFLPLKKQAFAFFLGLVVAVAMACTHYRLWQGMSRHLYILGILFLVAVLLFGATIRGTTGWFRLPWFNFQPVEFMKIILPLLLARVLSRCIGVSLTWRDIVRTGALTLVPVALVVIQPDLGSALVLIGIWAGMLLLHRLRFRQALALLGIGFVVAGLSWSFFLADYQRGRLTSFLNPAADPLGGGYNITQSIIAIGSGGWFGRGLGFGSQSQLRFLPEAHTDFVLAVIGEELGFVGILLVCLGFAILCWRMLRIAARAPDDETAYMVLGFGLLIFLQFFVNAGMNLGLMPVTGITLPFVSYGGSSLLFSLLLIGIVESVALRTSLFSARSELFHS